MGRLYVAYLYQGAMLEPENRDRRGETNSHVFFVPNSLAVFEMANDDRQGECRPAPLCAILRKSNENKKDNISIFYLNFIY